MAKTVFVRFTDPAGHPFYVNPVWVQTVSIPIGFDPAAKSAIELSRIYGVREPPEEVVTLLEVESE